MCRLRHVQTHDPHSGIKYKLCAQPSQLSDMKVTAVWVERDSGVEGMANVYHMVFVTWFPLFHLIRMLSPLYSGCEQR